MQKKIRKSFRLSPDADGFLRILSLRLGISETSILELAIRDYVQEVDASLLDVEPGDILKRVPNPDKAD